MKYIATIFVPNQEPTIIKVHATNQSQAIKKIETMNYQVLSIRPSKRFFIELKKKFPLDVFTEQFLSLQRAGLGVTQTIKVLANHNVSEFQMIFDDLVAQLESGKTLSEALENNSDVFPTLYITAVRSAERTGNLIEAIERYLKYHRQVASIKRRIISAITYPCVLLVLGISVLFFLLIYVVPSFSSIYGEINSDLSLPTQILLISGQFLQENIYWIQSFIVISIALLFYSISNPIWRHRLLSYILNTRLLQKKVRMHQLSGFYRTFGMLLEGGLPLVQALKVSSDLLTLFPKKSINICINEIVQGGSPAQCLHKAEFGDDISFYLIEAGEKSGNLAQMLAKVSDFYDRDIDIEIERFTRLLEPILMIFIGAMIGIVILIMYIPIFNLADSIQ